MNLQSTRILAAAAAAGLLLGGCGGGGNGSSGIPSTTSTNPTSVGKLSFAVGTANIQGTIGLNVAAVYRSSDSLSASLVNTPTISGPSAFFTGATAASPGTGVDDYTTIPGGSCDTTKAYLPQACGGATPPPGGPGVLDVSSGTLTGTPQSLQYGLAVATNASTFGQSGGVFSEDLSPGIEQVSNNQAFSYVPYNIDVYQTVFSSTNDAAAVPWGGPPAFDPNGDGMGVRDGLSTLAHGVLGIPEGFTAFTGITPATGAYTMSLSVATGHSGATPTFSKVTGSASITSTTALPVLDPTLLAFTPDGSGGATFTIPASYFSGGIKEVYVQIVDTGTVVKGAEAGNCQGSYGAGTYPVYYTFVATAAGSETLPDKDGPNGAVGKGPGTLTPTDSICTAADNTAALGAASPGDNYEVMVIGLDYDAYGNTFIKSSSPPSQVATWNGTQADISVSAPISAAYPAVPALKSRAAIRRIR